MSAGIVESSSRRMGNRSKTLLKKGQCLGERAILEGEPAAESCTAGSPVMALIVNRYTIQTYLGCLHHHHPPPPLPNPQPQPCIVSMCKEVSEIGWLKLMKAALCCLLVELMLPSPLGCAFTSLSPSPPQRQSFVFSAPKSGASLSTAHT